MAHEQQQNLDTSVEFKLSPAENGIQLRGFEMLAYTGVPVSRPWGKAIFDLADMEVPERLPILLDHDPSKRAGYADQSTKDGELVLRGRLSSATASGKEVADLSDEGFPWKASLGLYVGKWDELKAGEKATVNGREVSGPMSIGRKCSVRESSFLMAGADQNTRGVALAPATEEEARMSPDEFLAAHPESVEDWKKEAAAQERASLAVFLGEFPVDRRLWALERWTAGKTVTEAMAEMAKVLLEEAKVLQLAAAAPKAPEPTPPAPVGVGFNGAIREGEKVAMAAMTLEEKAKVLWDRNANDLHGEFLDSFPGFLRACKDGLVSEVTS